MQSQSGDQSPQNVRRFQFRLRTLFVAISLISTVLAIVVSGMRWHRERESIVGACLLVIAFSGFYSALQEPLPTQFLPNRLRSSALAVSAILGGWFSLVPLLWLVVRYKLEWGGMAAPLFIVFPVLAFVNLVMSWFGLFGGLGFLCRRGGRRLGLVLIGFSLVPLGTAGVLFGLIGIR